MGFSRWVHIEVDRIVRESDKALLFEIDGEQVWVPKSQIADPEDYEAGDENCSVSVTEFIAKEKGLEVSE